MTPAATRPTALPVRFDAIPAELRAIPRWVMWRYEVRDNKWTKPPYSVTGRPASSTDPSTWADFDRVRSAYETGEWDGVGLIHLPEDRLTGIDWDKVRDPATGEFEPRAADEISRLDTYAEVSPSETGVRAYARGVKPGRKCKRGGFELYDGTTADGKPGGRFLTVTGHRLAGCPAAVCERPDEITALYRDRLDPPRAEHRPPAATPLTDFDVLSKLRRARNHDKFDRLYAGDTSGYPSLSEADEALACLIAFYTTDEDQIFRLIRGSALDRDKWARPDYAARTVRRALEVVTEHYRHSANGNGQPHAAPPSPPVPPAGDPPRRPAWEIIRDHFRTKYRPSHHDGDAVYSTAEHRDVRRQEACACPTPELIAALAGAADPPQFKGGGLNTNALPGFFRNWAATAWAALRNELPDEDGADPAALGDQRELLRQLVREALLSEVTFSWNARDEAGNVVPMVQRRSLIGWCRVFAKPGARWVSIRSKVCWCREHVKPDGEVLPKVAVRHELFAQLKADRRLCAMKSTTFVDRAVKHGIGKPGGQADRPGGKWALVLDDAFVADLLDGLPDDQDDGGGSCTPPQSAT